jgi:hypothetical protein
MRTKSQNILNHDLTWSLKLSFDPTLEGTKITVPFNREPFSGSRGSEQNHTSQVWNVKSFHPTPHASRDIMKKTARHNKEIQSCTMVIENEKDSIKSKE